MAASEERQRPSSLYMDLKELRVRFCEVDVEDKGYIDYSGLQVMISTMEGFDSSASKELMVALDRDGDGKVTFEDFQILFTLERDAVKEQRGAAADSSSILSTSSNDSSYRTALYSPRNSLFFSPEKPQSARRNLNAVSDSPDLSMHIQSLQSSTRRRSAGEYSIGSNRQSMAGSEPPEDQVLEDTGTVGNTLPSPTTKFPPHSHSFMGLELIEAELQSICGGNGGIVQREDISKLCNRLGIDATDEQEFLSLWDELMSVSGEVSVDLMYDSIKQRETIAMVTSTPANQPAAALTTQHSLKERPKLISMDPLTSEPDNVGVAVASHSRDHSQQMSSSIDDEIDDDEQEEDMDVDHNDPGDWTDGRHFSFQEPMSIVRPTSAREGSRLSSKGVSDSSLRQTSMMQNFMIEFKQMQNNLEQVSEERDTLRQQLARAESDKKRLIQEGEESVLNLQRQKEAKIRKLENDFHKKKKSLESSLSIDYQNQQESLEDKIADLKQRYRELKAVNEEMKDDLRYYQSDREELLEKIETLHSTIKERDEKISILQERLGLASDSQSDLDLEVHSGRIRDLEEELQVRAGHYEALKQTNTELQDQVDELKAECEKMKMKYNEEKRKRQRRASDVTDYNSHHQKSHHHHHRKSRHSKTSHGSQPTTVGRQLPLIPHAQHEEVDYEDLPPMGHQEDAWTMVDGQQQEGTSDGEYSGDDQPLTIHDDILAAESNTSLLEEMRVSDEQHNLVTKIEELQAHRISLENTCVELRAKMNRTEENNITLKNKLEQEQNERETMARKDQEKIASLQDYIAEQKKQLQVLREDNESLQHDLNQQSAHITQIFNERIAMENQYRQLETKLESQEKELQRTETKACLAIVDLDNKEKECIVQQKKVEKLERELHRLHKNCDNYVKHIEDMKRQLTNGESEKKELTEARNRLQSELEHQQALLLNQSVSSGGLADNSVSIQWSPEQMTSSPVAGQQSFASSNVSQNEILHQMKGQLEQLQNVLIEKGPEEGSEIELSFVQELLTKNTDMEQSLEQQHQQFSQLVSSRDEHIRTLEEKLGQVQGMLDDSKCVTDSIQEEKEVLKTALTNTEIEKQEVISKLENELRELRKAVDVNTSIIQKQKEDIEKLENESRELRKSADFNMSIIQKQKEEIEKLNHYLGKARSKQVNFDTKNEEMERHIDQQNQQLLDQSKLIEELQRVSKSEPLLHYQEEEEEDRAVAELEAELLTGKEALLTAEDLISDMRGRLLDLYQHVMKPSDSQASDLLEFTDLINHLRETYDSINEEMVHSKNAQEKLEEKLLASSSDYESLWSEHDEEVKSLQQQNDALLLEFIDVEKNVEAKLREQMKSEKLRVMQELSQVRKENESINKALQKALEDKHGIKEAFESASNEIQDLHKSKLHLVRLVRTISIEALTTFSTLH